MPNRHDFQYPPGHPGLATTTPAKGVLGRLRCKRRKSLTSQTRTVTISLLAKRATPFLRWKRGAQVRRPIICSTSPGRQVVQSGGAGARPGVFSDHRLYTSCAMTLMIGMRDDVDDRRSLPFGRALTSMVYLLSCGAILSAARPDSMMTDPYWADDFVRQRKDAE
jgi:hypothetical protein